ncbi:MAG: type II toxin-antitoxin system VapC family toxin [Acidobacteria bacterium]|nr:type II toxin-antitoxin system VapC family toxin [Acidobacteriota bacterium]
MPKPILLDTDVLIDFLRGHAEAASLVAASSERLMVSSIGVAELYAGVRGGADGAEQAVLESLLSVFRVVPVSASIARLGGLYKRDYGRSHGVGLADGILAATATAEDAELMTLNVRHYPMFGGIEPAYRMRARRGRGS